MNKMEVFNNKEFGSVRIVEKNGEFLFVVKDVCEVFGDKHYRRSVSRLDEDEKGVTQISTPGGRQKMTVVNEPGLYSLLFYMQPEKANIPETVREERINKIKKFKKWVTSEVLPSIRKTGGYMIDNPTESPDEIMARALKSQMKPLKDVNVRLNRKIKKLPNSNQKPPTMI